MNDYLFYLLVQILIV